MERTVRIVGLREKQSDLKYWLSKSPQERLAAVETLRKQYVRFKHIRPGLQRVCRVINRVSKQVGRGKDFDDLTIPRGNSRIYFRP